MIRAIAIDDEPLALQLMEAYCKEVPFLRLVKTFENAIEGKQYAEEHQADLIFIDIDMPDISGLDLVGSLNYRPGIIFTTAYKEFALDGFELEALDYLLKPFSFERFEKAVKKAQAALAAVKENPGSLVVYAEHRMIKVSLTNIVYIESLDDYIKIHLKEGKPVLTLLSLKKALEKLPARDFLRIHRGFIVPVKDMESFLGRKLRLAGGIELPVGETYLSEVLRLMKPS